MKIISQIFPCRLNRLDFLVCFYEHGWRKRETAVSKFWFVFRAWVKLTPDRATFEHKLNFHCNKLHSYEEIVKNIIKCFVFKQLLFIFTIATVLYEQNTRLLLKWREIVCCNESLQMEYSPNVYCNWLRYECIIVKIVSIKHKNQSKIAMDFGKFWRNIA